MGNSVLRSLIYLLLQFLICELFIFFYLDAIDWSSKGVVIYVIVVMPIKFAVFSCMHLIFLIFTSRKENIQFPFSSVSHAYLLDFILLGFAAILFGFGGVGGLPGIQALMISTLVVLSIEICHAFYLRSREFNEF